jgi:hypothetical protein
MAYLNPGAGATREGKQAATVTALTNANGTGDNTIADVGSSFSQTTLNNNFRDLSDKVNAIITALKNAGLMA